ncbi:6PF2K-domain-containing protein [Aspergillus campestris IBT 28561]|uniref:Elongator complex protein 2 n=1 Tax=Aspergillus campestris (strain IBT 28561) TaxID=1392248 RepID=A0A2I1DAJ5_ASPC2|nr:6PF2K-domain-containing protein [Aspergillus campestris IBT 28561]PKY06882.1 6PF2K-domain-containing protein [Aspergillus campestris IBT 28561]
MDTLLTADIVVNSPRFRRKSSTFVDAIHDLPEKADLAPAQLYSTESGRLFHSGRIVIITVGLPARGKTHMSVALARYLRWLGVKTRIFHLGDYRRATIPFGEDIPEDYFFVNASASSVLLRQKIVKKCREDIYQFLNEENGQIAIYDAVNPLPSGRRSLANEFAKHDIETLFIESWCDDERIIEENVRRVKISSPDYVGWTSEDAVKHYLTRITARIPQFQTMEEKDLNYIKMINAGERLIVNNRSFGYLSNRIVFYLLNLHIKSRRTYFARAGVSSGASSYKADASLSELGEDYAKKMTECLVKHRESERQETINQEGADHVLKPLTIWTSTRRRTVETAKYLHESGYKVRQRSQLSQLNPGVCEKMSEKKIREEYPDEVAKHELDPYHHRYPRAESYHDLAVRLEPIILELEREQNDLLIIAHESVLRVLYGYLMACNAADIPFLEFPRDEIIEIIPESYQNEARRIHIPDLPKEIIPGSPEDIKIPVPPSGVSTPSIGGIGSPKDGLSTPQSGLRTPRYGTMRPWFDTNSHRKERGGEGDLRYGYGPRDCGSFERLTALIDKPVCTKNHYPIPPRRNNLFVSCVHATNSSSMVSITTDYISVGGNRHPAAADWDVRSGVLAFGADNNVALWDPADDSQRGVYSLLVGHGDKVTAVRFYTCPTTGATFLLTGSVDCTVRLWRAHSDDQRSFTHVCTLEGHTGSVNTLAVAPGANIVASGAADGTVRIWRLCAGESVYGELVETIPMKPRFFPLALALQSLQTDGKDGALVLAVSGTTNAIQILVAESTTNVPAFKLSAVLSGHEAWVRSLSFTQDKQSKEGDFLLASSSQDKYIRLWRLHRGELSQSISEDEDAILGGMEPTLSNKAHQFEVMSNKYSITFEALLFGNEDWIYTTAWNPSSESQQLLSASADNTLTIWEQDSVSGVWIPAERMGEISVQKGSTTATGSTGGFWIGLWSPNGKQVVSLGRTGSWRAWSYDADADMWMQRLGITGHVQSVNGIQWEPTGGYLLSTSGDQTTRLHAPWLRDGQKSWHEFSRPQIHGYDLNCIGTLGATRFVSGADEKLLRVFDEPKPVAQMLQNLAGFQQLTESELPDTAQIPVLGLSNQSTGKEAPTDGDEVDDAGVGQSQESQQLLATSTHPPLEDQLARYTLWPEHEKLYGHGYEISAVAVSHDRTLIATACKASSIDHAVIRLYDTSDWHEIRPSLAAHSLTITSLCFSSDDKYLLSVGRDRQWAVFCRDEQERSSFSLMISNPKGHSRMILDASWGPMCEKPIFATAGRDKSVKIWQKAEGSFVCKATIQLKSPVTAISFLPHQHNGHLILASGEESGELSVHQVAVDSFETQQLASVDRAMCPSKAITELMWRPLGSRQEESTSPMSHFELAVASEDTSMRVYNISDMVL